MEGRTLQLIVRWRMDSFDDLGNEILSMIKSDPNPPALILNAVEGFYPSYLQVQYQASSVRKSCVVLLEQLIMDSPPQIINVNVRTSAMIVAMDWRMKLSSFVEMEVLGFLLLVCAYGLVEEFDKRDLFTLSSVVQNHRLGAKLRGLVLPVIPAPARLTVKDKERILANKYHHPSHLDQWSPPPKNWVKVNFDGSFMLRSLSGGLGMVARDDKGNLIGARAQRVPIVASAQLTELLAAREALKFASTLVGFNQHVEVEGDCKKAIVFLLGKITPESNEEKEIVADTLRLADKFSYCDFIFNRRLCNQVADGLAKHGRDVESLEEWKKDDLIPNWISQLIDSDKC